MLINGLVAIVLAIAVPLTTCFPGNLVMTLSSDPASQVRDRVYTRHEIASSSNSAEQVRVEASSKYAIKKKLHLMKIINGNDKRVRRQALGSASLVSSLGDHFYIPAIMAEMLPAAMVSRKPSVITLSGGTGCPSGHFKDIRGNCKRIFQYSVNYGPPAVNSRPTFMRSHFTSKPSGFLWNPYNRATMKSAKKAPMSLRDLIKSSTLFKKSEKMQLLSLSQQEENTKSKSKSSSSGETIDNDGLLSIEKLLHHNYHPSSTPSPVPTTTDHDD